MTGYPSIDKPWLKYYSEEAVKAKLPECTIYDYIKEKNKNKLNDIALNYFDRTITYKEFFDYVEKTAKAFTALGVKSGVIRCCLSKIKKSIEGTSVEKISVVSPG